MRQTRESYVTRARELKNLALVLGDREDDTTAAVDELLDATGPDVLALRRPTDSVSARFETTGRPIRP